MYCVEYTQKWLDFDCMHAYRVKQTKQTSYRIFIAFFYLELKINSNIRDKLCNEEKENWFQQNDSRKGL